MKMPNSWGREPEATTFLFFSWTLIQSFRLQLQKNCQHLTNLTRWNKHNKVWGSSNSLFKWRFRNRHRYLSSNTPSGQNRRIRRSSIVGIEVSGFFKWHFISWVEVEYMNPFLSPFNLNLKLSFPMRSYEAGFASWHAASHLSQKYCW